MKSRLLKVFVLVAIAVPFSGCPLAPSIRLGVWLLHVGGNSVTAVRLLADGQTDFVNPPPPEVVFPILVGTWTWEQNGGQIVMVNTATGTGGTSVTTFTGEVLSETKVRGTTSGVLDDLPWTGSFYSN